MKRLFDILASAFGFLLLSPLFGLLALLIVLDSRGGVFFRQVRVGKEGKHFGLYKFRSMRPATEHKGQLTVKGDHRITRMGKIIRKYKLDELPQLWNVLRGDMSIVGPRPEVPKYVAHYNESQKRVLSVRPGLTDYASLEYLDEEAVLAQSEEPEKAYICEIMPRKLELNLMYIDERASLWTDLKLILKTIRRIVFR
jgi:lipopolysaccharide/colanic/teichoic acid biosynthesis glycosyltransferase